jgi:Tol biopolymer transport system component
VIERGGNERQLTRWVSDADPEISPDGRHVAFVRGHGVSVRDPSVYVMNADGSGQRLLGLGGRPRWSPDGNRIAYVEDRAAPQDDRIVVADSSGGGTQAEITGDAPTWSPDGRLAFMRYEYVQEDRGAGSGLDWYVAKSMLFIAGADGSGERMVASFDASDDLTVFSPAWSPDGRSIAVASESDYDSSVLLINVADGTQRTLPDVDARSPEWSSDGQHLLAVGDGAISIVDALTGETTRIVDTSGTDFTVDKATWSPDGTAIGFIRCNVDGDVCDVYAVDAQAGAKPRRLTRTVGIEDGLDWGP